MLARAADANHVICHGRLEYRSARYRVKNSASEVDKHTGPAQGQAGQFCAVGRDRRAPPSSNLSACTCRVVRHV